MIAHVSKIAKEIEQFSSNPTNTPAKPLFFLSDHHVKDDLNKPMISTFEQYLERSKSDKYSNKLSNNIGIALQYWEDGKFVCHNIQIINSVDDIEYLMEHMNPLFSYIKPSCIKKCAELSEEMINKGDLTNVSNYNSLQYQWSFVKLSDDMNMESDFFKDINVETQNKDTRQIDKKPRAYLQTTISENADDILELLCLHLILDKNTPSEIIGITISNSLAEIKSHDERFYSEGYKICLYLKDSRPELYEKAEKFLKKLLLDIDCPGEHGAFLRRKNYAFNSSKKDDFQSVTYRKSPGNKNNRSYNRTKSNQYYKKN